MRRRDGPGPYPERVTETTCERCGEILPDRAKFCPNCGFPTATPPAEERKIVTVIFVDLVGSTQISSEIDPERYREVIAAYYREVSDELESLRGRAYNFAGDAVVGVFGIPTTHDDDALRAIRAGLALVGRVERLGERLGLPLPLRVRIGINTGSVAIGTEGSEQGLLFGATVNLAARLQQAADPASILVTDRTWLLTQAQVEYGERREVRAKGFDDVAIAWPVISLAPGTQRRTIPFVNRKRELRLLNDTFEGAVETRRAHLVSLFGEPGIGKSRVAEEFLDGLPEGTKVMIGRASPYEEDVTFAPLAQILLHELGERDDAPAGELLERLHALADACCPADHVEETTTRLALALGIGEDGDGHGGERRYRVAEIRAGLLGLLEGISREGPIVLVFEDAHLAQPPMLDLIEQVVREAKHLPVLLLCVSRYDLLDDRPEWGGGLGDSLNLYLEPMQIDDATMLAREASEGIDEATAERVARHAGGNPFFIVETTGMLRHIGREHLPSGTSPLPSDLLPPTVQAVIASRIDHLPSLARDLVRKASVFARSTFEVSELALIADPSPKVLELLEDEELLLRDDERQDVWRFRHGLVRDVAYESLPKRERQRLHLLVADALAKDEATAARYPRSIAYHLERAAVAALDLDPRARGLAERAVAALAHAGDLAHHTSDALAASDLYSRALAMSGPRKTWGLREAKILSNLGESRYWLGAFEAAANALERALELAPDDPVTRAQAGRFLGDIELSIRGNRERAEELFASSLAAARDLDDPWVVARTLLMAGWGPYHRGDLEASRHMFEEALAVARGNKEGDAWAESRALITLAGVSSETGDEEDSFSLASQGLVIAETRGDPFSVATARDQVAAALRRLGRLDEAVVHADAAVTAFRELGARWELASALTSRGLMHRLARRGDDAIRDLREAFRICLDLREKAMISWTSTTLAKALAEAGDPSAARRVLADAAPLAGSDASWTLAAEAEILLVEGDRDTALERALVLIELEREGGWPKDAAARTVWAARVFGDEVVEGDLADAEKLLAEMHLGQATLEADLVASIVRR
jgi:class 3 adenylate cyclase/tetratricopeptide (TPR) repeat protein